MIHSKYSFITWSTTAPDAEDCAYALPNYTGFGIAFLLKDVPFIDNIYYVNLSGSRIYTAQDPEITALGRFVRLIDNLELSPLKVGECFYIEIAIDAETSYYSNLFRYLNSQEQTSRLVYYSPTKEDVFDFNYSQVESGVVGFNSVDLPFIIKHPQFPQEMGVYKALDGTRKVLYSTVEREFELETDAMTEQMHANMVIALSHDAVKINGIEVTKVENYTIDWNDEQYNDCGEKVARATARAQYNEVQRNSNC